MSIGVRILSDVCVIFRRPRVWGMLFWCANGLELVVETFDFDASWCNLYNSILDEYELGGLYVSM